MRDDSSIQNASAIRLEMKPPDILSLPGIKYVPFIPTVRERILSRYDISGGDMAVGERRRSVVFDLEVLPYTLGATSHALFDFFSTARVLAAKYITPDAPDRALFILSKEDRHLLGYRVDSFLEASRRAQNALIPYISRSLSILLPNSMNDLMKGLESQKIKLSEVISSELKWYWEEIGKKLKEYRDLSRHHALVASDAKIFKSSDGKAALYLLLPNNPEIKSIPKLSFEAPEIHAGLFLIRSFEYLVLVCNSIMRNLIPDGTLVVFSDPLFFSTPLVLGTDKVQTGYNIVDEDFITEPIMKKVRGMNPELSAFFNQMK